MDIKQVLKFFTDRIRMVLFGIAVILFGIGSPSATLRAIHRVLDRTEF
jgi:hypothetical protein